MNELITKAVESYRTSEIVFTKFITANDTGTTGAHQSGYHINKSAWNLFFDTPGEKGANKDLFITIKWQDDFETNSRFIYYGQKTRNEYRLTRFGRNFPYLSDNNVGDLLVICKKSEQYYYAYVISGDENIEDFLSTVGLAITETNKAIIRKLETSPSDTLQILINDFVSKLNGTFPTSKIVSGVAEDFFYKAFKETPEITKRHPDKVLLNWIDTEYLLFKAIESSLYSTQISTPFKNIDDLIDTANTLLNRRKSRAGKALENHLASLFDSNSIKYETQVKTEGNKKPDFIFPDGKSYHDSSFYIDNLFFLGAKTTCKDRWRQILNEADRIETKHLMTLQQGISANQLKEMKSHNVVLVVPEPYKNSFPKEFRTDILSLNQFMHIVKTTQ